MGFVVSIIYFVTYYLTPANLWGPLAAYRIELILAVLAMAFSVSGLSKSIIRKTPQPYALIGLAVAIFLSVLIGMHWSGGAVQGFLSFIPNAFAYFLICLNFKSRWQLQVLVGVMLIVCLFVIGHGYFDLINNVPVSRSENPPPFASQYLLAFSNDAGDRFARLRGPGDISDPNDFAQLIVCLIPLIFIFWRPKRIMQNVVLVLLPVCALLYGAFLTHSRGSLVALMAVAVVALRRRLGTIPALVLAAGLFIGASALNFTGGREISANAGSDRTSLWGVGLQMVKSHPVFGVGFGDFSDYSGDAGLTAHNSIVVCAAELGLFGLFFWTLFLFATVSDALAVSSSEQVSEAEAIVPEEGLYPHESMKAKGIDRTEIIRLGRLAVLSLTGFLVAGLFLSRAFVMTLFIVGGVAEAVYQMALQRGMIADRMRLKRVLMYVGGLTAAMVPFMYVMVRFLNLMR
jgi:hypothetical protein